MLVFRYIKMFYSKLRANFKEKTKPFTHTILGQTTFMAGAIEPMMYVGI